MFPMGITPAFSSSIRILYTLRFLALVPARMGLTCRAVCGWTARITCTLWMQWERSFVCTMFPEARLHSFIPLVRPVHLMASSIILLTFVLMEPEGCILPTVIMIVFRSGPTRKIKEVMVSDCYTEMNMNLLILY